MALSKNLQYIVAGFFVLYIVFFTRPAPTAVVNLLASPVSQLAALAVVVYVGASVSLLVAVVAALAVVLSIPNREYAGHEDDKTMTKKEKMKVKEGVDEDKKKDKNPVTGGVADLSKLAMSEGIKKKTADSGDSADKDPEAAGDKAVAKIETKGSESFCLQNAAPF
jgi:hypothetical protein